MNLKRVLKTDAILLFSSMISIVIVTWILYLYKKYPRPIEIEDIWVINLDKDLDRWKNIEKNTENIRWKINRWPATYGKNVRKGEAHIEGVSQIVMFKTDTKPSLYYKKTEAENNQGKIGCWLSHKRLLTYLASKKLPDSHAHLIVEDDIMFHKRFLEDWNNVSKKIPADWDMVYLGINFPILSNPIDPPVYKGVTSFTDKGNWGTQAYLVRHGSIRSRILPKIKYMSHEIDVQLNLYFDELNVYVVYPNVLSLHSEYSKQSTIEQEEK